MIERPDTVARMSRPADRRRIPAVGVWCSSKVLGSTTFSGVRDFVAGLEALGIGLLWVPESFGREVMAHVALLLDHSERLIIGTGIANVWARDAVAMANGIRTLSEAHPGRVLFGLGISHRPNVARRGQAYARPLATMRGYLEAMRDASWDGLPQPAAAPVVLAALGPRMLRLAAEMTDGAHPFLVTPEHTARAREVLGRDLLLAPELSVLLETDPEVARQQARTHLAHYLDRDNYQRSFLRQGFATTDLASGGSDRLVDGIVAWGHPERIAGRVRQHLDAGADHVALQVVAPTLPATLDVLRALVPALKARRAS